MTLQHHIALGPEHLAGNGRFGRYVFLPGDPARAEKISRLFTDVIIMPNSRGLTSYRGSIRAGGGTVDVLAISTGMGPSSVEIVVHELLVCGARRFVRVGSAGSTNSRVKPGHVVIATAAVRDEDVSDRWAPREFPAVSHPDAVAAMTAGAVRAGLASETFRGICHSKSSLYAREFGEGPDTKSNREYVERLGRCGVIASEMDASTLFILAATSSPVVAPLSDDAASDQCQAAAVLAVFGSSDAGMSFDPGIAALAEERAIRIAVEGVGAWWERDHAGNQTHP